MWVRDLGVPPLVGPRKEQSCTFANGTSRQFLLPINRRSLPQEWPPALPGWERVCLSPCAVSLAGPWEGTQSQRHVMETNWTVARGAAEGSGEDQEV